MPPIKRYEDQITTPLPLAMGVALRVMAIKKGISISMLVRNALINQMLQDKAFQRLVKYFETKTPDELIKEKVTLTTQSSLTTGGQEAIESYLNNTR